MERRTTGVLVLLLSGGVTYALSQTLILPAMPALVRSLDADPLAVSWLLTAFLVAASVATPLLGRMGDLFGRGRVLTATMAVFLCGSALCAMADSLGVLIFGRVLQGAAGAVFPLAYGIIRDTFPEAGRMRAIGILSVTLGVGAAFGPVVAGAMVDRADPRTIFWIPIIGALPALGGRVAGRRCALAPAGVDRLARRLSHGGLAVSAARPRDAG